MSSRNTAHEWLELLIGVTCLRGDSAVRFDGTPGYRCTRAHREPICLSACLPAGLHMGFAFLSTEQGRLEHMNPVMFMAVPQSPSPAGLKSLLTPAILENLAANQHALVSNYDWYWTWVQLAHLQPPHASAPMCPSESVDWRPKRPGAETATPGAAVSLFDRVPTTRNCDEARIDPDLCKCVL